MRSFNATVGALSTPPGKGGVALIRVSGAEAIDIADACFRARNGKPLCNTAARTAVYGDLLYDGAPVDDVMVTVFRAPHSYTGEDTVEITCHGSMLVAKTILTALFEAGALPAERGEFTRRALVNGKLSLTEAESIGELLDAKSFAQIKLFERSSRSRLSKTLASLYDRLTALVSAVYAKIDYPDEDLADMSAEEIAKEAEAVLSDTLALSETYRTGRAIAEGIPTVLLGKPNTGKSSLYNLLCGEDAAIVTEHAGTTRDVLESAVCLGRTMLRLWDTAGVRETLDPVERIGVERSREKAKSAELILTLFDASLPFDQEDEALLSFVDTLAGHKVALLNKSDLPSRLEQDRLDGHFDLVLPISALTGDTASLAAHIDECFTDGSITVGEDAILSSSRQYAAVTAAAAHMRTAIEALRAGCEEDAAVSDLELALSALSETDGRAVSEDVVSGIFSRFCVGK
ncbi:MAG: tRNA uridine-5-carboxymethylaminomethyl(34) synthesis GTPase MnmE [Clostridia bacterium]|nr:tRNA uridine-5-carboxymethylaminomethyl(34) synthesis GTPase MnmE [Clostridia bacterium]